MEDFGDCFCGPFREKLGVQFKNNFRDNFVDNFGDNSRDNYGDNFGDNFLNNFMDIFFGKNSKKVLPGCQPLEQLKHNSFSHFGQLIALGTILENLGGQFWGHF